MSERYNMIDASTGTSQSTAERILRALEGIRYGAVEIIIHAGRIVQIERKEKVRFDAPRDTSTSR